MTPEKRFNMTGTRSKDGVHLGTGLIVANRRLAGIRDVLTCLTFGSGRGGPQPGTGWVTSRRRPLSNRHAHAAQRIDGLGYGDGGVRV